MLASKRSFFYKHMQQKMWKNWKKPTIQKRKQYTVISYRIKVQNEKKENTANEKYFLLTQKNLFKDLTLYNETNEKSKGNVVSKNSNTKCTS